MKPRAAPRATVRRGHRRPSGVAHDHAHGTPVKNHAQAQAHAQPAPPGTATSATSATSVDQRRNWFDDPFAQATDGLPGCPRPEPPLLSAEQMRREAHWRAERGTSCYRSGRCRLPNAYLYDREIVPRVVLAIHAAGTFEDTALWVQGQRRWIWLKGCVSNPEQARRLEALARLVDDVEAVIPQLIVGTTMPASAPAYALAASAP